MSRNNTGNPIGSKAFPDFEDNVKNLDEAVNTADPQWVDRFGRFRLPLMEQERQFVDAQDRREGEFQADQADRESEFNADQTSREQEFDADQSSREAVFSDFLQASGYQDLGEYAPGIEITAHNQYVTFGGQPYLLKPSIPVPYTTSGEWTGDDFKLIGDDTLRQDLANPDNGAAMVAYSRRVPGSVFRSVLDKLFEAPATPEDFGAEGDGVTDDADYIQAALDSGEKEVLLVGGAHYLISKTLVIPPGVSLRTNSGKARLTLVTSNIPAFELMEHAVVSGVDVYLPGGNTSDMACAFRLRTSPEASRPLLRDFAVYGSDMTANAIYVGGDTSGNISFGTIEDGYCFRVKNFFKADIQLPAYANGFTFNNIVIRTTVRAIWLSPGSSANIFTNLQWNTSSASVEPVYIESSYNRISGWFYDLGDSTTPLLLAKFEGSATNNAIESAVVASWRVEDNTPLKNNHLFIQRDVLSRALSEFSYMPAVWSNATEARKWGEYYFTKPYGGHQDNALAYADRIQGVASTGATHTGTLGNAFNPFAPSSSGKPNWVLGAGQVAQIEINITEPANESNKRPDFLQVVFTGGFHAQTVKFEIFNGTSWVEVQTITGNDRQFVVFHGLRDSAINGVLTEVAEKFRISLSEPASGDGAVRVEAINGRFITKPGFAFMPRGGGKMYGRLEFVSSNEGPVLIASNGSKWRILVGNDGALSTISVS